VSLADRITELLARRVGLDVDALGRGAVEATLKVRQRAAGGDPEAYLRRLSGDEAEATALIDELLVPETWFFRDGAPFEHLAQLGVSRLAAGKRMTVLSLPCSTGEEAYSIAMTLFEAGLPQDLVSIDAIDLSPRLLERGKRGVYDRGSFRGADLGYRERHFVNTESGWRIGDHVRGSVKFSQGNCLDPGLLAGRGPYDAVFFRNLLIYLTPPARLAALGTITSRLADDGVVYAGHAEALDRIDPQYRTVPHSGAFAFRRVPATAPSEPPRRPTAPIPVVRPPTQPVPVVRAPTAPIPVVRAPTAPVTPPVAAPQPPSLAAIRQLADRGALVDAATACEHYQRANPLSGEAFYLRGLIHAGANEPDAARAAWERALYLAPDHYEALIHLALAAEQRGDRASAERLRRRAERVAEARR
jgi:chemotaxis protein methyltransferase WspC